MKQIIRDSSAYYLLGYNSTQAPTDGKFHKIKVERDAPGRRGAGAKGLLGLHRRGCGARDGAARRGAAGGHRGAATLVDPPRGRPARFWIGTARGENGKRGDVRVGADPAFPASADRRRGRALRDADRARARRAAAVPRTGS